MVGVRAQVRVKRFELVFVSEPSLFAVFLGFVSEPSLFAVFLNDSLLDSVRSVRPSG